MFRVSLYVVLIIGVGAAWLAGATVIVANPQCSEPGPADAIVVLGAHVLPNGTPTSALRARAEAGATLMLAGKAAYLVPTGGTLDYPPSEASAIAKIARDRGVDPDRIVMDEWATSTEESAINVRKLAGEYGWKSVIVVSDGYHLARAGWMFRDQGFDVQVACSDSSVYPKRMLVYQSLREVAGLAYYAVIRMLPFGS